ncbi:MAG: MBL fold metallo-hydrolase [Halodesulfurarchaeum sp.]
MAIGEVRSVETVEDVYYVDTGMFDTVGYGAVYVVDGERLAVLDSGIGTHRDRVFDAIDAVGLEVTDIDVIALSHVHLDHAGGAGYLAAEAPDATVYAHEIGAPHLVDPDRLVEGTRRAVGEQWQFYTEPHPVPEDRVEAVSDGDRIDLGDRELLVGHVPGHAPHQVLLYEPYEDWVHVGDAAGIWIPALDSVRETSPPPDFDFEQALDDIDTISDLSVDTMLYPHFGPVTEVDYVLDAYKETLTGFVEEVERVAATAEDEEEVIQHFLDLQTVDRVWDDVKARGETAMNVRGVLRYLEDR